MNFELTPQQKAVQQSARQFAQTVLQETVLEDDAAGRFPEEAYKKMGSFCLTEPDAGSDAAGCKTTAIWNGKEYILNGLKCFITNGPLADYYMVVALTNPELKTKGLTAFIVEREWEGVSIGKIEDKCGIRCAQVSEVIFDNVRVPKENMLGEEGKGFAVAMKDLDGGRIGVQLRDLESLKELMTSHLII